MPLGRGASITTVGMQSSWAVGGVRSAEQSSKVCYTIVGLLMSSVVVSADAKVPVCWCWPGLVTEVVMVCRVLGCLWCMLYGSYCLWLRWRLCGDESGGNRAFSVAKLNMVEAPAADPLQSGERTDNVSNLSKL